MQFPMNVSSFSIFRSNVTQIPVLTREEEFELASNMTEENTKTLILSHLRFVLYVVNSYKGYKMPEEDLVQEGIIGLMKAVKKFDPTRGFRLASYAMHYIKNSVQEYILKNFKIAKIATTKSQRKLFFGLRQFISNNNDYTYDDVAEHFDVDVHDVIDMHKRLSYNDVSTSTSKKDDEGNIKPNDADSIASPDNSHILDFKNKYDNVIREISVLPERQKYIINERWLAENKKTLNELGDELGVSAERVRQIESETFEKIKNKLIDV